MEEMPVDKVNMEVSFDSTDLDPPSMVYYNRSMNKLPGDEVEKECPLCKSVIRYFFVNFNEKALLCENQDCEYPFGCEDLEFVKQDEQCGVEDELESITTIMTRPAHTGSVISTHAWTDIEKLNKAYDSEDCHTEATLPVDPTNFEEKQQMVQAYLKEEELEEQTKKNIEQIKKLNVKLQSTFEDEIACIRNEKWIKHLMTLQGISGVQLLKKKEMMRLKAKQETNLGSNELTIGIDQESNVSSITIELPNNGNVTTSGPT